MASRPMARGAGRGRASSRRSGRTRAACPRAEQRGAQPNRQRLHLSETAIRFVEDVSRHPLVTHYGEDLAPGILRTLQALRVGAVAEPPLLMALFYAAQAGAATEGLGPTGAPAPTR